MSRNAGVSERKTDRRVRRTRERLGDALVALVQEKPFHTITVQDVLDRAGVGRSTFYVHYRDKDDLFLSDAEEFFEGMATMLSRRKDSSDRVAPVRENVRSRRPHAPVPRRAGASGRIHDVMELGQGHFARAIEHRLAGLARARGITAERRTAVAHALAGVMLSLLSWWIGRGMPGSLAHMDGLYHRMLWTSVNSAAGRME